MMEGDQQEVLSVEVLSCLPYCKKLPFYQAVTLSNKDFFVDKGAAKECKNSTQVLTSLH